MDTYATQLEHYRSQVLCRKKAVEAMLQEWQDIGCGADCEERPDAPCCILQTEHNLLVKYVHILDRELWYISHKNERSTNT